MYNEEYTAASNAAKNKIAYLKRNPLGYFVLSMLAGMYIGFGVLLIMTVGGQLAGSPATKLVMGLVFGIALSLVVIAGAELFTGNTMVMSSGLFRKAIRFSDALLLWIVCWIGNLAGSFVLGLVFHWSGLNVDATAKFLAGAALGKMSAGIVPLIMRGILCNILVCLAVWCSFRCKSDSGKLIMVFWCLLAFITTGFEHSVANMTLFSAAVLDPAGTGVNALGAGYNLLWVTIGNMIGGILFVSVPYMLSSRDAVRG
jgi:nitrite transporter NirC